MNRGSFTSIREQVRERWSALCAWRYWTPSTWTQRRLLAAFRFGGAVLLYALVARVWLYWKLGRVDGPPFSFDPHCCSRLQLAYWMREDVAFASHCTLVGVAVAMGTVLVRRPSRYLMTARLATLTHLPALTALLLIGLVHTSYYEVALVFHGQLGPSLISEALQSGFGFRDILTHLSPTYALLTVAPTLIYATLVASSPLARALQAVALGGIAALLVSIPQPTRVVKPPLQVNPVASLLQSVMSDLMKASNFRELDVEPTPEQLKALGVSDPSLVQARRELRAREVGGASVPVNILVIVLESVGGRYAFQKLDNGQPVMPLLTKLRDESLYFANHLSPSNSSANSLYSFFTGLYPAPSRAVFSTRADLTIPVFHDYLPWQTDAFVVSPGRLNNFFPRSLLTHAGMDLQDLYNLGLRQLRPSGHWGAGDERDGVDAFLARLKQAKAPYFGVYYSYAAHFAYYDHGPEFRILPDLTNNLARYYNNLRLLDVQLERMLTAIRARGERTLVVILGDHGEAFGQHKGNRVHSQGSYQENYETFALVNLANTFPSQTVSHRTLHIDLLPTILSGLGIDYPIAQFQGENVLAGPPSRRYSFLYGNEDTLSSIDGSGIKVQLLYGEGACRVFNLETDPLERQPLPCGAFREQMQATGMFHAFQPQALRGLQERLSDDDGRLFLAVP